jgi:hypothetical protein
MNITHHFFQFQHPTTVLVAGPTQAGKTEFVINIIKYKRILFSPVPDKIYWAYGQKNDNQLKKIQTIEPNIEFIEGCPNLDHIDPEINNLLILDDLMDEIGKNQDCSNLFTRGSHHKNITVIGIIHNLYNQAKHSKTISLNTHHYFLFKSPRDNQQIAHFGRQIFPLTKKFIPCALALATKRKWGYLGISLDPNTPDSFRVFTGIFPFEIPLVFLPSN